MLGITWPGATLLELAENPHWPASSNDISHSVMVMTAVLYYYQNKLLKITWNINVFLMTTTMSDSRARCSKDCSCKWPASNSGDDNANNSGNRTETKYMSLEASHIHMRCTILNSNSRMKASHGVAHQPQQRTY